MKIKSILIANRGEIAVRIARTASDMGIETVAIYSHDDRASQHVKNTDHAYEIDGVGAAAYLDGKFIIDVAMRHGCDAIHPGYGFLSENADFAKNCAANGIKFIGPEASHLALFGDKGKARVIAERCGVALIKGTEQATSLPEMKEFFEALGDNAGVMIKAVSGGGGRGMRAVHKISNLEESFVRCQSEALAAFGKDDVYIEQLIKRPRHIEVQIIGDGRGGVSHLWDRECTIQRRHQKVIEIAPSPSLKDALREKIISDAVMIAREVQYEGLGTFEFLLDEDSKEGNYYFIEVNPRIQVEHTVTEEIFGVDLVQAQISVASGLSLEDIGFTQEKIGQPTGYSLQLRVNMEVIQSDGSTLPSGGVLESFDLPSGPGVRVDSFGYQGYETNPNFDSLLAKVIVSTRTAKFEDVVHKAYRAIREFRISGVETNIAFLQNILCHKDFLENNITTGFIQEHLNDLVSEQSQQHKNLFVNVTETGAASSDAIANIVEKNGYHNVLCPMQAVVVGINVEIGEAVFKGQTVAFVEAMKMEHEIKAGKSGYISQLLVSPMENVRTGQLLLVIEEAEVDQANQNEQNIFDIDMIRPDLADVLSRQASTRDDARPKAVEKRRKTGQRTARENIDDLLDAGSFTEYGSLVFAAQRSRRTVEDLIEKSPADGLIAGIGSINGNIFEESKSRCMVVSYDYSVFAGTQGAMGHKKKDRMFDLARKWKLPVILFSEGGGGRPGDTDVTMIVETPSFLRYAKLSGLVPLVGIVSGYCFAGNAALLGCSDVIIATKNSCIGMAGPAMIEGGGLGVFKPTDVGPVHIQSPNGVIDIVVDDEEEAVKTAKQYISYFQGPVKDWEENDQRLLRHVIPENRVRTYDVREVITIMADKDSVLELRKEFGIGIVTSFIRIEGRPFGVIANNNRALGGAIDSDSADKSARFIRLCQAFNIPLVSLCDTPGFMVGPAAEETAQVRHFSRMFVAAANCNVPIFCVVLRKAYGLGALAMTAGSFHAPMMSVSWPTGEFGGMGLEGGVRLSYRRELEAIEDLEERKQKFNALVEKEYEKGKALSVATYMEFDNVIDPMETRKWLISGLKATAGWDKDIRPIPGSVDTW
ncbi:MAG: hypothetical protein K9G26_11365 [Emcibacter sp.]|nr:hypothetical protein [Emcibacter sp.]